MKNLLAIYENGRDRAGHAVWVHVGMRFDVDDSIAYQLAQEFKREVYAIANQHPRALKDFGYIDELFEAASSVTSNIAEGIGRGTGGETRQFLRYALGSLNEARTRLCDGVDRGYFTTARCADALGLAKRTKDATKALYRSVKSHTPQKATSKSRPKRPRKAPASNDDSAL